MPLATFLFDEAKRGRVRLDGMDAGIGAIGEDYTNTAMVPELGRSLPQGARKACIAAFAERLSGGYPSNGPRGVAARDGLIRCVGRMRSALRYDRRLDSTTRGECAQMLANPEWWLRDDLAPPRERLVARERWMFSNLTAIRHATRSVEKTIIWGATVHLGRDAGAALDPKPFETLGHRMRRHDGAGVRSLGFAAWGVAYRVSRQAVAIPPPPPGSLEGTALSGGGTAVYLNAVRLAALGPVPGGVLTRDYPMRDWSRIVDGVVIFAREWPSHNVRLGYPDGEVEAALPPR